MGNGKDACGASVISLSHNQTFGRVISAPVVVPLTRKTTSPLQPRRSTQPDARGLTGFVICILFFNESAISCINVPINLSMHSYTAPVDVKTATGDYADVAFSKVLTSGVQSVHAFGTTGSFQDSLTSKVIYAK